MTIFLPIMTGLSGSALLANDCEKIGVQAVSLYLDALLVKPGLTFLKQLPTLGAYVGWQHEIVLNAANLKMNASKVYPVRSPFDGRIFSYTEAELLDVIQHLNPTRILLPTAQWCAALSATMIHLFVPEHERAAMSNRAIGGWFRTDEDTILLTHEAMIWRETEKPMLEAMQGLVYAEDGTLLDINMPELARVFQPLSATCLCEACQTKLTISYFHHLLTHTPGLCQRFLIQHNLYFNYDKIHRY